ncbi:MAG: c-type cytochrome [Gammaproteobacteria bacterium]|nr:c-type cytochrome [Gammaproteobacteria bacterium]
MIGQRYKNGSCLLKALLLCGLFGSGVVLSQEYSPADGAKLYNDNCARCHNPRPAEQFSAREWSVIMPHMREKAHLTRQETEAVERFLASTLTADIQRALRSEERSELGSVDGEQLFSRFGCQGCHQINGEGGSMGPNLSVTLQEKGEAFMIQKILDPAAGNPASTMPKFPVSESDASAIVEHIKTLDER